MIKLWKRGFCSSASTSNRRKNRTLMAAFYFCLFYYFALINFPSASAVPFKCNSNSTCNALVDYFLPNTTTISAVQTLFGVPDLFSILGANALPLSTDSNQSLPANTTFRIRFPCLCTNGTGISNRIPVYTVVSGDDLFHIASDVFSGLVTYQEIQAVNNITDPNRILVGQKLWIPLPCSCDDEDGRKVVHYGHKVASGNTLAGIAEFYNTSQDTLLNLNGLASPKDLLAGAILDVPLPACVSPVSKTSLDYPLLVTNGSYAITAGDCVMCDCDASNNWTLTCSPSELNSSIWESCPNLGCNTGTVIGNLSLGNLAYQGCNRTTCTYTGYNNQTIFSQPILDTICPATTGMYTYTGYNNQTIFSQPILDTICPATTAPSGKSSSWMNSQSWKLNVVLFISLLMLLLCL